VQRGAKPEPRRQRNQHSAGSECHLALRSGCAHDQRWHGPREPGAPSDDGQHLRQEQRQHRPREWWNVAATRARKEGGCGLQRSQ
jgi:hypothetical protein